MKYKLTLTEEQARVVSVACEFFARIKMGQFGEIPYHCMMEQNFDDTWCDRRDTAEYFLFKARESIYPDLHGSGHSYGVGRFDDADTAFDVHQVLRYSLGDGREPWSQRELPTCEEEDE